MPLRPGTADSNVNVLGSGGAPEIREMARRFAKGSIVCDAAARLIEQVLLEVHDTQIAPRDKRITYLENICRQLGSPEHAINRDLSKGRPE